MPSVIAKRLNFAKLKYNIWPSDHILRNDDVNKPPSKPMRRLLRISLRAFLLLLTVGCVWVGWKANKAQKQRAAVAWVEEMGGFALYNYDYGAGSPDFLNRGAVYVGPPQPAWLRELIGVSFLSDVTRVAFVGDRSFTDISPLEDFPKLRMLEIHTNSVSDLSHLNGLTELQYLDIAGTSVSDLSPLEGLTKLQYLDLDGTPANDLSPLEGLTELQYLEMDGTPVRDLSPLEGLTNLKELLVWGTNVREENYEMLKRALPECWIDFGPRSKSLREP